ncbi:MAG TPA: SDR family oxidoreductase, partial [Phocaeicola coprocola]|nr:SDR family oxidoreductase [Phocaeicola coprocola]
QFLASSCKVVISGTNEDKLKRIVKDLDTDKVSYVILDTKNVSSIKASILDAEEKVGKRISIFVYSAGVHGNQEFGNVTEEIWDNVLNVNLKGMYFFCQEAGRYMTDNKVKGNILNVSSASALKPGWTPYEISKSGVKSLTLGVAAKLIKHGITVNAIAPGPVATKMIGMENSCDLAWPANPAGRVATPEEIGNMAVFMVSDSGKLIVGDTFYMTGGSGTISLQ